MAELLIARIDAFTKEGRYVPRGQTVSADEVDYNGDDAGSAFISAPSGAQEGAIVQISAIAPTGPNPTVPQQIAPDVVQTERGYVQAGATLVGEVTKDREQRIEIVGLDNQDGNTQAEVTQALADANANRGNPDAAGNRNVSNEGTEGTVADISARVADMDAAELDRLEAAENDREVPRKGVQSAIERRRAELA